MGAKVAKGRSVRGSAIRRARVIHSCLLLIPVVDAEVVNSFGPMAIRFMLNFSAGYSGLPCGYDRRDCNGFESIWASVLAARQAGRAESRVTIGVCKLV